MDQLAKQASRVRARIGEKVDAKGTLITLSARNALEEAGNDPNAVLTSQVC